MAIREQDLSARARINDSGDFVHFFKPIGQDLAAMRRPRLSPTPNVAPGVYQQIGGYAQRQLWQAERHARYMYGSTVASTPHFAMRGSSVALRAPFWPEREALVHAPGRNGGGGRCRIAASLVLGNDAALTNARRRRPPCMALSLIHI